MLKKAQRNSPQRLGILITVVLSQLYRELKMSRSGTKVQSEVDAALQTMDVDQNGSPIYLIMPQLQSE